MPEDIERKAGLHMDPGLLRVREPAPAHSGKLEIVVPYTSDELTGRVMHAAASMAHGLNAILKLVAVYVVPFPAELRCPASVEEYFVSRLAQLARQAGAPATVELVVARDHHTGFRHALLPHSAVLLGSARRLWRTREEKLAGSLIREGHLVSLLHFN